MWDTLIGGLLVIAGGLVALGGNYWIETQRWKREDLTRYHQERLNAYRNMFKASTEANLGFSRNQEFELDSIDTRLTEVAIAEVFSCNVEIQLVAASHEVRQASASLSKEVVLLRENTDRFVEKGDWQHATPSDYDNLLRPVSMKRDKFLQAVRNELGMNQLD